MSWLRLGVVLALVAGIWWALSGEAPTRISHLDVAHMPAQAALSRSVSVVDDPQGQLDLAELRSARGARLFRINNEPEIARGFTSAVVWVRLEAANTGTEPVRWLLELDEPTLDDVRLYVFHTDGRAETRRTGDMLPFSTRDVAHGNFVFDLTSPPGDVATCFLRLQSEGPLRAELSAWQPSAWTAQAEREDVGHWLFYGGLGAITLSFFGVFVVVGAGERLWSALLSTTLLAVQATFSGHLAQYLLPNWPRLANRVQPIAVALVVLFITLFVRDAIRNLLVAPRIQRVLDRLVWCALPIVAFAIGAPVSIALPALYWVLVPVCVLSPVLVRVFDVRRHPEIWLYLLCWLPLVVTAPLTLLRLLGVLPPFAAFEWSLRAGMFAHGLLQSIATSVWINEMREKLASMNAELSTHVSDLRLALARAEDATQHARRATRAKDEFMATMSHELRTPLNAIINIPQGMIDELETVRTARCSACAAGFVLDDGDVIGPDIVCEACGGKGTLVEGTKLQYTGDFARFVRYLRKIEVSGQHLLQMVNGVLDYSKMEAGRFELTMTYADLGALTYEVVDQMSDLAQRKGLQLTVDSPAALPNMVVDVLRIKQVLINLIANGIKFSEPGTAVRLSLRAAEDGVIIEVQDTGIGIADEDHERIFASFEQVHKGDTRKYGGTGLGLSISRSLVRMHGGELTVRSAIGQGSTFVVRLPGRSTLSVPRAS